MIINKPSEKYQKPITINNCLRNNTILRNKIKPKCEIFVHFNIQNAYEGKWNKFNGKMFHFQGQKEMLLES